MNDRPRQAIGNRAMKNVFAVATALLLFACAVPLRADDSPESADDLFKKLDVNGDGKLTASEIPPQHRKFFERLVRMGDADKNGELTREEFDHAMRQTEDAVTDISKVGNLGGGPPARPNMDPKRIFQSLDKNKDGKLTRDELEGRPRLLALFDRLGKEELTLDDLSSALGNAKQPNAKKLAKKAAKKGALAQSTSAETGDSKEMSESNENAPVPAFFRMLDTNHDGRLSPEELAKAGDLFEKLDRNHDGFLDPKELMSPPPAKMAQEDGPSVKPGKRFAKRRNAEHMVQMIMRADADGDGKISLEEAPPQLKKHFARLDTNGDGYLDRSELEAWAKRIQKRQAAMQGEEDSTPKAATPKTPGL
jgi:Ca2+-binding EF-hand superfamily protein